MLAVTITRPGGPDVLELRQHPDPVCGPEDVLVEIRAAGLNRADLLQRRGRYPAPPGAPADIPGLEFAGQVAFRGPAVRSLEVGDRVMGILGGGGYAERVALHERLCLPIPPGLGWDEAAAVPEAFLTAYDALFAHGRLAAGEAVLLHAAGSGIGTAAAQLAGVAGATIVALSRTPAKRERLERLGLQHVLDAGRTDLDAAIRTAAGGGIDLVLDPVGAATLALDLAVLNERGRVVVIGLLGGADAALDLAMLLGKRATLIGSVLRSRPLEEKVALVQEFRRRALPLLAAGRLRAVVDRTIDWEHAAEAHGVLERNENFGKVVLRVGASG